MARAKGTDRILDIIEGLASSEDPQTRASIARITGMPRSTTYALVDSLRDRGWVEEVDGRLRLGPRAGFVSQAYLGQKGFEALARDILVRLSVASGALAEIDVVEDGQHIVAISEGSMAQGYVRPIEGARLPLLPTAAARVMLADMDDAAIRALVNDRDLTDVAGRAVPFAAFMDDIRHYRAHGHAIVPGWFDGRFSTLACAMRDAEGRTVASLCLIVPTRALEGDLPFHVARLTDAARDLSALLVRVPWPYAQRCWHQLHAGSAAARHAGWVPAMR